MEKEKYEYRDATIFIHCSAFVPVGMSNREFEEKLVNLLTCEGKFNFHGQITVKDRI